MTIIVMVNSVNFVSEQVSVIIEAIVVIMIAELATATTNELA